MIRSVIAFGKAEFIEAKDEKIKALQLLCEKYSPGIDAQDEINRCLNSVLIICIRLKSISGKEAVELVRRKNIQ